MKTKPLIYEIGTVSDFPVRQLRFSSIRDISSFLCVGEMNLEGGGGMYKSGFDKGGIKSLHYRVSVSLTYKGGGVDFLSILSRGKEIF